MHSIIRQELNLLPFVAARSRFACETVARLHPTQGKNGQICENDEDVIKTTEDQK